MSFIRKIAIIVGPSTQIDNTDETAQSLTIESTGALGELRIDFKVQKSNGGAGDTSIISIYNLSESTRAQSLKRFIFVEIKVGYVDEGSLTTLSKGSLMSAVTERRGPDTVTTLTVSDSYQNVTSAIFNKTYRIPTVLTVVIANIVATMPNLALGEINVTGSVGPRVFHGLSHKSLSALAKNFKFSSTISDGVYNAISDSLSTVRIFTASARLGNLISVTPNLAGAMQQLIGIRVKVILDTHISPNPSDKIVIESEVSPTLNGTYRAMGIIHTGSSQGNVWESEIDVLAFPETTE